MGPRKNVLDSSRRERKGGWRGPGIVVISQFRNPRIEKLLVGCISGTLRRKGTPNGRHHALFFLWVV